MKIESLDGVERYEAMQKQYTIFNSSSICRCNGNGGGSGGGVSCNSLVVERERAICASRSKLG